MEDSVVTQVKNGIDNVIIQHTDFTRYSTTHRFTRYYTTTHGFYTLLYNTRILHVMIHTTHGFTRYYTTHGFYTL